jgi:hypothetical protein
MKINVKALTLTGGILWGAAVFLAGIANLIWPGYAATFLEVMASIYPGYEATPSIGFVIIGTLYALLDGAIAGLIFAWLYNRLADR